METTIDIHRSWDRVRINQNTPCIVRPRRVNTFKGCRPIALTIERSRQLTDKFKGT